MSEEKAKYGTEEAPIEREKRRFAWLHNKPDGTVCSSEDAEGVRWDPRCQEVRCFECGMIFHAGAPSADDLIAAVKQIFEGALETLKRDNQMLDFRVRENERMYWIVLALLLEAYGKPFTVDHVHLINLEPRLSLHWREEPLARTFWVEKQEETPAYPYGRSPMVDLMRLMHFDQRFGKESPGDIPGEKKSDE